MLDKWITATGEWVVDIKQRVQRRVTPKYRETYKIDIKSPGGFDNDELRTVIREEIPEAAAIEAKVTRYFSEDHLGPKEHQLYYQYSDPVKDIPYRAEASVELAFDSNWESGEIVVKRVAERLEELGSVQVSRANPEVDEPLSG